MLSSSGDTIAPSDAGTHSTVIEQVEVKTEIEVVPRKNTVPDPIEEEAPSEESNSIANSRGKRTIKPNPKHIDSVIAYALSVAKET